MANFNEDSLNLNLTTSQGTQVLYQPVLNRQLLASVRTNGIHHQFGQKTPIPKGKGKLVAWDKMSPLPKAKKPLEEGITPVGTAINISRVTAVPEQYGAYISITDRMDYFTPNPDPQVLKYNERLADNAAETLDSLTADVLAAGTNVQYAGGKTSRAGLTADCVLTVDEIRKAVRTLKGNKAKPIDRDFVCIIHTDAAYDLMSDPKWETPHMYSDTKELYNGEIGRLYGVRFVETPDAVVFRGTSLKTATGFDELSVVDVDTAAKKLYIYETLTPAQASALANKTILVNGFKYTVASAAAGSLPAPAGGFGASLTLSAAPDSSIKTDMKIYSGEGAGGGVPVYSTLVIGADAYGVTDPKSTIENITKPLGSAGTADPLDQRSTMGWKSYHLAKILADEWMVRIESVASRYAA
ncbi:MAG: N4-gp56 family major capsid protein [bacterium]|nr:N4-gp56 family major capsid protein [bacterium]